MYIMESRLIVNHPEWLSQDAGETGRLYDGLQILARIIARDLLSKRSVHTKNDTKESDTNTLMDSNEDIP
jgi:hypothetical protein